MPISEIPLGTIREHLEEKWRTKTGHRACANNHTWACELARLKRPGEHMSIACSLLRDANDIGRFLDNGCFDDRPDQFARLFSMLLHEFVHELYKLSGLIGFSLDKPPQSIAIWANKWAKHRLHIMVQHHPQFFWLDRFGDDAERVAEMLRSCVAVDSCGVEHPLTVIDQRWLEDYAKGSPDLDTANSDVRYVILFPSFSDLLNDCIDYFRKFVDVALQHPDLVRRFSSPHFDVVCRQHAYLQHVDEKDCAIDKEP